MLYDEDEVRSSARLVLLVLLVPAALASLMFVLWVSSQPVYVDPDLISALSWWT